MTRASSRRRWPTQIVVSNGSIHIPCRPTDATRLTETQVSVNQKQENQFDQGVWHAKGEPPNSKVPGFIRKLAPKALGEALSDPLHPVKRDVNESYATEDFVIPKPRREVPLRS